MRILIIEDDETIGEYLLQSLESCGYQTELATTGADGRALLVKSEFDGVVMDLMLPDTTGFDLTRQVREQGVDVPILMLTARQETESLVQGLDSGADDYLTKPFEVEELLARLRAMLRRNPRQREEHLACGGLVMDRMERTVRAHGASVRLTPKEFALLEFFMQRLDEVVDRAVLLEEVWGIRFDPGSNIVDVHVTRLRNKLGDCGGHLVTVRGRGYMLAGSPGKGGGPG